LSTLLSVLWRHCSKGAKPREDFFSDIVDGEHHIVIESKIDTTAWDGQLEKYDAEMHRRLSITPKLKATIIYITRDFERPKATSGDAHFVQTRWECFLQTLEAFCETNSSWFVAQVRDFMIEQRIATPVQVAKSLTNSPSWVGAVQPFHVAAFIKDLQAEVSPPTVKQHLAAIRMLCDWLVTGHIIDVASVT
jgi:hypothetical protein